MISVEPHSALAAWFYYRLLRGRAPLFIHHHEYYAREDFESAGMRLLRRTMSLEREYLFPRAVWISQTNATRLRLLRDWNRGVSDGVARVLPNYPPADWIHAARTLPARAASRKLRMVYIGSASFEDTFIREAAEWVGRHPETASLHVAGNNVSSDVWEWLESMHAPNITFDRKGYAYEALPELLGMFDVGLILYKGNTANFVHNVPNKAVEYLACGLNVWYPIQMQGMAAFHNDNSSLSLRQIDFDRLADMVAGEVADGQTADGSDFPFTAEAALAPLIAELEKLRPQRQ